MSDNTKEQGRAELKQLFSDGRIPSQDDFGLLIDSTINKQDDGFSKDDKEGFIVAASADSRNLISFYTAIEDDAAFFSIASNEVGKAGLKISPVDVQSSTDTPTVDGDTKTSSGNSFYFHPDGSLGIGKMSEGSFKLDVNGFAAFKGRIGTYKNDYIPADGRWHDILPGLDDCQAFEIIARTGKTGTGRFSMLHAFAVSAFGGRAKSKIRKTSSHYGFFWNKINLKWEGSTHSYALKMRTGRNYGKGVNIYYYITKLWDDSHFMPVYTTLNGKVVKVEGNDFLYITIETITADKFVFILLADVEGSENWIKQPQAKLLNKNVTVEYKEEDAYNTTLRRFTKIKELKKLKMQ